MLSKMPFRMIRRAVKRSASINNAGLRKNGRRENVHRRNPVRNARRRIALMNGNMLESGGKMTLHIRRNRKQRQKAWRTKNPDYDTNRYATDPEYAESRKAARRERYAE